MQFKLFLFISLFALLPYNMAFAETCSVDPTLLDNPGNNPSVQTNASTTFRDYIYLLGTTVATGGQKIIALENLCVDDNLSKDGVKVRRLIFSKPGTIQLKSPLYGITIAKGEKLIIKTLPGENVTIDGSEMVAFGDSDVKGDCGIYTGNSHEYLPDYSANMQPFLTQYYSGDNIEFQGSISVVNYPGHGWCIAGHNNILERMLAIHNELDGFKISGNFAFLKGIQSLLNSSNGISLSGNGATIQPSVINSNSGTNKIQLPVFAANSQKGIYIESSQNNIFSTQSFSNKEAGVYISGNQSKINLKELIAYDNKAGAGGMGILFAGYINDDIKAPTVVELTNDGQDNLSGSVDVHLIQPDTSYELHVYIAESKDMTDGQPTQARYLVKTVILVPNMQKSDGVYSVNILADEIKKALGKSVISQETYFTFMLTDPSKGSSVYSLAYKKPEKPTILLVITPAWLELLKVLANPDFLKAMDEDGDGTITTLDNCPSVANADQLDTDGDKAGDACDADDDNDGVNDGEDNCPLVGNPFQEDADGDGAGAVCDPDDGNVLVDDDQDDDGVKDAVDNCPNVANADQADVDHDSEGDLCDSDDTIKDNDSDGVEDAKDNCPSLANPDQTDSDSDGTGDVCEPVVTPTPTPTSVATPTPTSTPTPTTKPTPTPVTSCPDGQVLQGGQCVTPVINLPLEENSSGGCSLQPNFEAGASPWVFKGLIALWVGLLYLMRRDLKAKNLRKI